VAQRYQVLQGEHGGLVVPAVHYVPGKPGIGHQYPVTFGDHAFVEDERLDAVILPPAGDPVGEKRDGVFLRYPQPVVPVHAPIEAFIDGAGVPDHLAPDENRRLEYEAFVLQYALAEAQGGAVIVEIPEDFFFFVHAIASAVYHARIGMSREKVEDLREDVGADIVIV